MELSIFPRFFSPVCSCKTGQLTPVPSLRPFAFPPCFLSVLNPSPVRASVLGSNRNDRRFHTLLSASSDGVPSELSEDSKFVPLNDDDPIFGPPALLLLGFEADETVKIQEFLRGLDGEFLKVIHCTEEMIKQTLWDVFQTEQPNLAAVKIAKSLPRVCIFSGLSGEEIMMFIDIFPESGLKPPVFAALVPNSAGKILEEVIAEIMGDHEMLTSNRSE
ncbi:Vacuolar acid trehalase [Rhynchospora pubera]|uniref:Vacuolar acid trehalase n=1 Tax=Rhynchospora pubera TaxID=906938 RepID=A0AAV8F0N2_9POAL|nr:Vacuolar acid trehalase [Rhynchospora pubera]KAJ4784681.1 Vacuolar acid trehalase [Rhynchospora pubera]